MDNRDRGLKHGFKNCGSAFFDDMPMIVTSSPIEGRRPENSTPVVHRSRRSPRGEHSPTWSQLLCRFQATSIESPEKSSRKECIIVDDPSVDSERTSSSYEPIAEHKMKVLLTPGKKLHVLSSSSRKIKHRQATPGRPLSYSKLNQEYRKRLDSEEDIDESIHTIKNKLKNADTLSLSDIAHYEQILLKLVNQKAQAFPNESLSLKNPDLVQLIEKNIGECNPSPRTCRILKKTSLEQEKRLISLATVKRKTATEIKKKMNEQLMETKNHIKDREQMELKFVKAAQLRKKALTSSTLFNEVHSAHHKRVVAETRHKNNCSQLQRKLHSEKLKTRDQVNKTVQQVWGTFFQEQYNQLREEVQEQKQNNKLIVKESEAKLQHLKSRYEEKLKELKEMTTAKAAEAGLEKKEMIREIERIQRKMRSQFQTEYQNLLQKIETKGENTRFAREEKANRLKAQLQKADYVFDV